MIELQTFEKALKQANSLSKLHQELNHYLASHNIGYWSFTYYATNPNSKRKIKYDICSEPLKIWHQHFISEDYASIDSTMDKLKVMNMPYYWDVKQQLIDAKSARERQMRQDALDFGADCGLCIPLYGGSGEFAILLVDQMCGETCLSDWRVLQFELLAAGHCYFLYLQQQMIREQPNDIQHQLSQREMQCLILTSNDRSVAEIAEKLHITERTVNYHIQKLLKKFMVKNKYQAVAKATENGILV